MSNLVLVVWFVLLLTFVGFSGLYYFFMRRFSLRQWNVKRDKDYRPMVTILIPAHNEEKVIGLKLKNLMKLDYPKNKLQIIVIDDGSTDNTLREIREFQKAGSAITVEVLVYSERMGKSASLNLALKNAEGELVVVSDADCFLSSGVLREALPFLSDPDVGAVTGLEVLLNPETSWVTKTEKSYNDAVHTIRIGESKVHSTILFQGGFGAYKRSLLDQFDVQADDSGTALNIVQKGARTLLLPEAVYFTMFASVWRGKFSIKLRRATQLIRLWFKSLRLFLDGTLLLPKKIFLPESFLYLVNPFVFICLIAFSTLVMVKYPVFLVVFSAFLFGCLLFKRVGILFVELVQNNIILLLAILCGVSGRRFSFWSSSGSARSDFGRNLLESKGLI